MTIKGRVKVNAGPAPRFARRPVGPSGPGVFFRWALALSLTALAALVAGALATYGLSAALARPPSPPLLVAAGALAALVAIVLPPIFFDRAVTRAYRRLSPDAPSLLAQSLASWAVFALLGACLGAPRQTRAALEAKGAWPLDPASEGAQRLAGLVRRAVAKLPHSEALESPGAPEPSAHEAHSSPTASSHATPAPIASAATPAAAPIASAAATPAAPIASTAASAAAPIASAEASAAAPIASAEAAATAPTASAAASVPAPIASAATSAAAPIASAATSAAPFASAASLAAAPFASATAPATASLASAAAFVPKPIGSAAASALSPIAAASASAPLPIASASLPDLPGAPIASAASPAPFASAAGATPVASTFAPFTAKLRVADLRLEGDELSSIEKIQLAQVLELLAAATEPCLVGGPLPAHIAFRAESKGPGPQFVADGKPAVTSDLRPEGDACLRKAPAFVHTFVALALGNEHGGALSDGKKLVLSFRLDAPPRAGAGEGATDTTRALVRYELVGAETQWDVDWD